MEKRQTMAEVYTGWEGISWGINGKREEGLASGES